MQVSKNFRLSEFKCRDAARGLNKPPYCNGSSGNIDTDLITGLQDLRDKIGNPVIITSGYRCPAYNTYVKGASSSQHMFGTAVDIRVDGMTSEDLMRVVEQMDIFTGRGLYPGQGFIHVDTRRGLRGGRVSRWIQHRNGLYETVGRFIL